MNLQSITRLIALSFISAPSLLKADRSGLAKFEFAPTQTEKVAMATVSILCKGVGLGFLMSTEQASMVMGDSMIDFGSYWMLMFFMVQVFVADVVMFLDADSNCPVRASLMLSICGSSMLTLVISLALGLALEVQSLMLFLFCTSMLVSSLQIAAVFRIMDTKVISG